MSIFLADSEVWTITNIGWKSIFLSFLTMSGSLKYTGTKVDLPGVFYYFKLPGYIDNYTELVLKEKKKNYHSYSYLVFLGEKC